MWEHIMEAPASARTRVLAFLDAFRAADNDVDIELRLGRTVSDEPALIISIADDLHALTVREAAIVAKIMEEAMNEFPDDPEWKTLPNMILMLKHGIASSKPPSEQPKKVQSK